jgi:sacsin
MASPREHIEHIRKTTFSIGGERNPLAPMLDQAVKYLSAELYTKDVHFLMELIQVFLSFLFFFLVLVLK